MFDSPLEESMPGQVQRFGLGYHGFVEFPALQSNTSCPGSAVKLTTYNGLTLYPFPASLIFQRRIGESAVLFRDPRAIDLPGDEEDEAGRDWRRYAIIQIYGIRSGAGQGEPTYNYALHTSTRNLFVNMSPTACFVTKTRVLARRSASTGIANYPISGPAPGNSNLFADAVPTGARSLYCNPGGWLREVAITGDHPAISPVSSDIVGQAAAQTETTSETGTAIYDVGNWEFGAFATGSTEGNYSVVVIDRAETGAPFPDGEIFGLPYSGQRSTTRRRIVGGFYDGERIAQLWSEDINQDVYSRTASWGVTSQTVTDDGAQASSYLSTTNSFETIRSVLLIQDGTEVSRFEIKATTESSLEKTWTSGAGSFAETSASDTSNSSNESFTVTLDGADVIAQFPGEWEALGGGGYGLFYFDDASAPSGEQVRLQLNVGVYSYSMQLKCLRVEAIYTRRVSDVLVETRVAYFYGNACSRGVVDSGVFSPASGGTLYGSADPLTGEIRRNYPYPVTWC